MFLLVGGFILTKVADAEGSKAKNVHDRELFEARKARDEGIATEEQIQMLERKAEATKKYKSKKPEFTEELLRSEARNLALMTEGGLNEAEILQQMHVRIASHRLMTQDQWGTFKRSFKAGDKKKADERQKSSKRKEQRRLNHIISNAKSNPKRQKKQHTEVPM